MKDQGKVALGKHLICHLSLTGLTRELPFLLMKELGWSLAV
jgi:hypothetical protein